MFKLLTIIIPTYNMEAYLHRCLDSLILQKELMNLLEVLVINDGSKDSSSNIAHEYETCYPNTFKVIDKENGNYGSCINKGIDEAKGKYIKILDADDWYEPTQFAKYLQYINTLEEDVDAVFSNFTYHYTNLGKIVCHKYKIIEYEKIYELKNVKFVGGKDQFMLKMYSIAVRTQLIRDIGLRHDTGISYTDYEFIFFPYEHIKTVIFLRYNVYQYFIGREGQTISPESRKKHVNDYYVIASRFLEDYFKNISAYSYVNDVKEYLVLMYCLSYVNNVLEFEYNEHDDNNLRDLYKKIKKDNRLIWKMRKRSPFFLLWEITKMYKKSKPLMPLYKFAQLIKTITR